MTENNLSPLERIKEIERDALRLEKVVDQEIEKSALCLEETLDLLDRQRRETILAALFVGVLGAVIGGLVLSYSNAVVAFGVASVFGLLAGGAHGLRHRRQLKRLGS